MNDIKSVLHLYLGCDAQVTASEYYGSGIGKIVSIDIEGCVCVVSANTPNDRTKYCVEADLSDVKPILSRLSDMTEEDAVESAGILGGASHLSRESQIFQIKELFQNIHHGQTNVPGYRWMQLTVYLLSKGYWLFDESAFDSGIILDKKTLKP